MAFAVMNTQNEENNANTKKVDYAALNRYTVEAAGLQQRETIPGRVSMIVDLGLQKQEDAKVEFNGTAEDEAEATAKFEGTYFETDSDGKRYKRWKQKPKQAVAVAIDFPEIILDKGEFYGESNPQPLRLWLGKEFWMPSKKMMIVAQPTILKEVKGDNGWSFSPLHLFYKMAVASKLIKAGEPFKPHQIDQILGKTFLFDVEIKINKGKDQKEYLNEYVKFSGGLARGMQAYPEEDFHLIQFDTDNDPESLKQLRKHVINTASMSSAWNGSKLQKQLEELGKIEKGFDNSDAVREEQGSKVKVETPSKSSPARNTVPRVIEEDDSGDVPF